MTTATTARADRLRKDIEGRVRTQRRELRPWGLRGSSQLHEAGQRPARRAERDGAGMSEKRVTTDELEAIAFDEDGRISLEIGRASCRERV